MTKAYVIDVAERIASTFVTGAAGSVATVWIGSAFGVAQLVDLSSWEKIGLSAAVAGFSAVGTTIKSLLAGVATGTASLSKTVATTAVEQGGNKPPVTVEAGA